MSNEESKLKLWYVIATPHEDRTGRTRTSSAPFFSHFLNLEILVFVSLLP